MAARARAAVETDGRMILPILKNNETEAIWHLAELASLPVTKEWCTYTRVVGYVG